ncbi:MAG: DUF4442 domain-containing protein [Gammaproteobacteria bacterium]|nr:DUF4442 domain-containing protein [Gammaproteobacteria bacterium]
MEKTQNPALKWGPRLINFPGMKFFVWLGISIGAPYSANIRPRILHFSEGHLEIRIKKRWALTNHMRTVHAVAMANLIELTASGAVQASIPKTARWIPRGMNIQYLKKAKTDLRSVCKFEIPDWNTAQDFSVSVDLFDTNEDVVAKGEVVILIGPKSDKR